MIQSTFKHLAILAATALTIGCAATSATKSNEDMAIAAGFKTIKPTKPDQKAALEKLPSDKFTRITYSGKTYYVLPDKADGQAYVGGPKQYQAYQEDSQARAAAQGYDQATSSRASEADESGDYGDLSTWQGWAETRDWSQTDGQTD